MNKLFARAISVLLVAVMFMSIPTTYRLCKNPIDSFDDFDEDIFDE